MLFNMWAKFSDSFRFFSFRVFLINWLIDAVAWSKTFHLLAACKNSITSAITFTFGLSYFKWLLQNKVRQYRFGHHTKANWHSSNIFNKKNDIVNANDTKRNKILKHETHNTQLLSSYCYLLYHITHTQRVRKKNWL